jgi:subtilase family serine protease
MLDDTELILSKTKSFKMRLLNSQLIKSNKTLIQVINTAAPIIITIIIGLILNFIRRRKYVKTL